MNTMSTTTSNSNNSVLAIGLVLPPSPAASAMQAAVSSALQKARDAGYDAQMYAIDPTPAKLDESMAAFRDFLAQRSWDAAVVGWGIRGNMELTELFERIVNTVVEVQLLLLQGKVPRFVFSLKPDGFLEAAERVLGRVDV